MDRNAGRTQSLNEKPAIFGMHARRGKELCRKLLCLGVFAAVCCSAGCSLGKLVGGGGGVQPTITYNGPANGTIVQQGQSVGLGAVVMHTGGNPNITWSLSGPACPDCGTITLVTPDGNNVTYTAPQTVSSNFVVTVTATSAVISSLTTSVQLQVTGPVSVTIQGKVNQIQAASAAVNFTASVANDVSKLGVTWSIAGSCAAGCGTLSNQTSTSVTYTPPQDPPAAQPVILVATSKEDKTKSDSDSITITPAPITVTINDKISSIAPGAAAYTFEATITHDLGGRGVNWSLSANGAACAPACGSLGGQNGHMGNVWNVVYTPPASLPASPDNMPVLTAASGTDPTKTDTDAFTISQSAPPLISVTITDKISSILASTASVTLNATVQNDPANKGVTWMLTANGANCAPTCGMLSNVTTSSVSYSPPTSLPAAPDDTPAITATSVADSTKSDVDPFTITGPPSGCSSGNEKVLNGEYAYLLQGADSGGFVAMAGSFTANGTGGITAGLQDVNRSSGSQTNLTVMPANSSYSVGADNRGCLTLQLSNNTSVVFRFAVGTLSGGVATKGSIIEFDDATGTGTRTEGFVRKQDSASFATSGFQGNYVFAFSGSDSAGGRFVLGGVLTAASGALSNGNVDSNDSGVTTLNQTGGSGVYSIASSGRGTASVTVPVGSFNFALYMVSSSEIIAMTTDTLGASHPIGTGELLQQTQNSFDNSAMNATSVFYTSGIGTGDAGTTVTIGLITPDGKGNYSLTLDQNAAGTFTPTQNTSGTYSVSSNGRLTTTVGKNQSIVYLVGPNEGFTLNTSPNAELGFLEPQTGGPFSNASLSGNYFYGTEGADAGERLDAVGAISFDGSGNYSGTEDDSTPGGLFPSQTFATTYSFSSSSPQPGRGVLDPNNPPHTVAYIISPTKLVYLNTPATYPRVVIVEK